MFRRVSRFRVGCLLCLTAWALSSGAADIYQQPVTVFTAISLTNALQEIGAAYAREHGRPIRFSFASTWMLARRIDSGADADIFISADRDRMDYLAAHKAIKAESERNLVGNEMVLIAPTQSKIALKIKPHFGLRAALGGGRLALGDPELVPAGRYARSALMALGVWADVANSLLPAEDVRTALLFVGRGDVPLGIVYRTDVLVGDKVRIVDTFPADTHPPVVYPVALTAAAAPGAQEFMDYLNGPTAAAVFKKYGFTLAP